MTKADLTGIRHVTVPVRDPRAATGWVERWLNAQRVGRSTTMAPRAFCSPSCCGSPAAGRCCNYGRTRRSPGTPVVAAVGYSTSTPRVSSIGDCFEVPTPDGVLLQFYTDPVGDLDTVAFKEPSQ
jgi:catechol 2,3-dioxygenase-like lactoylglutathione lyase family enzyme